jgi:uncharacterized membrane protein YkvA (DUF1232 family)
MDNPYYDKAQEKAEKALKDESRIRSILRSVGNKLKSGNLEVSKLGEKVRLLVRMVKAYVSGHYRVVPWKSIIIIVAVLIYFLMPLDLIADFIPVTGYVDDFTLVLWAYNHLKDDINTFEWWEQNGET